MVDLRFSSKVVLPGAPVAFGVYPKLPVVGWSVMGGRSIVAVQSVIAQHVCERAPLCVQQPETRWRLPPLYGWVMSAFLVYATITMAYTGIYF